MAVVVESDLTARLESLPGEIRWFHVARSRAIRRIIDKSIARWARLHGLLGKLGPEARYHAVLQREGEGHMVLCQIEIIIDSGEGKAWMGSRVGQGLQAALADCLAHMTFRHEPLSGGSILRA